LLIRCYCLRMIHYSYVYTTKCILIAKYILMWLIVQYSLVLVRTYNILNSNSIAHTPQYSLLMILILIILVIVILQPLPLTTTTIYYYT